MENRFLFDRFPYVSDDVIKSILEPGISKIKRLHTCDINDDNSNNFVLLDINKLRYCNIGIIVSKIDDNNNSSNDDDDKIKVTLFPRDVFISNDNDDNDKDIKNYDEDMIIEKPTIVLISKHVIISHINKTCRVFGEYFLENSVRLLTQKISYIGQGLFGNYTTTLISFRNKLTIEESQYFVDEITTKENQNVFKTNSLISDAITEANKTLSKEKYIECDIFDDNDLKINFKLRLVSQDNGGTGGNRVWDASSFLGQWIVLNPSFFKGKNCIELGAGLGLPGLAAATIAAKVSLTDCITEVLDNLTFNVEQNQSLIKANTEVFRLDWYDENERLMKEKYDVVLVADVIYTSAIVDVLIATIIKCNCNNVYVSMPTARMGASEFIYQMKDKGFTLEKKPIPSKVLHLCNKKKDEVLETFIYHFFRNEKIVSKITTITSRRQIPNYFIAIRLKSNVLQALFEDFQRRVVIEKYKYTRTSSKRIHLTLFVLSLKEGEEVEKAKELFRDCNIDLTLSSDLMLGDVTFFGNKVLKIDVIKDELYQKINEIGKILHDKFTEHGLIQDHVWSSWEPHVTIAKTSADRKNYKKLKFDKDMINGEEKSFHQFPVPFTTIDMLLMSGVDDDGYYKSIETKDFMKIRAIP